MIPSAMGASGYRSKTPMYQSNPRPKLSDHARDQYGQHRIGADDNHVRSPATVTKKPGRHHAADHPQGIENTTYFAGLWQARTPNPADGHASPLFVRRVEERFVPAAAVTRQRLHTPPTLIQVETELGKVTGRYHIVRMKVVIEDRHFRASLDRHNRVSSHQTRFA